jgi:hypothetical protein
MSPEIIEIKFKYCFNMCFQFTVSENGYTHMTQCHETLELFNMQWPVALKWASHQACLDKFGEIFFERRN